MLRLNQRKFLLLDFQWLVDWFNAEDTPQSNGIHGLLRQYYTLETFIHLCLHNLDANMNWLDERIQPEVETNVLTTDQEQKLYKYAEALYTNIHWRIEDPLSKNPELIPTPDNNLQYDLIGFTGTTGIIGLGESTEQQYPTFEESYGSFGNEKWRSEISNNPLLQAVAPIIIGKCAAFETF